MVADNEQDSLTPKVICGGYVNFLRGGKARFAAFRYPAGVVIEMSDLDEGGTSLTNGIEDVANQVVIRMAEQGFPLVDELPIFFATDSEGVRSRVHFAVTVGSNRGQHPPRFSNPRWESIVTKQEAPADPQAVPAEVKEMES